MPTNVLFIKIKMPTLVLAINFKMPSFDLVINFQMPTTAGILKFMTRTNDIVCCSVQENCQILFVMMEDYKFHAHLN